MIQHKTKNLLKYLIIFIVISVNLPLLAQINTAKTINDKYLKIEKISNRVIIVGSGSIYYTSVICIKTDKGLIAIDAGSSPVMTANYRKIIEQEFRRNDFVYLINTHGHYDHTTGNQAFSDVPIIAHENCEKEIVEFWVDSTRSNRFVYNAEERLKKSQAQYEQDSEWWNFYESLLLQNSTLMEIIDTDFKVVYPSIIFSDRLNLQMGDITLQLIYFGEAHTTSDILIYIPEEKILFIGDLFDKGGEPDFDLTNKDKRWLEVMDYILQQEIEKVIYGHGLVFTKEDLILFNSNIIK
ncbi:MAG: hypothetical protein A2V66_15970 [Ignavibacteria bacterium RBG_13_36_8]|nr:MAG: hypothetical protein A2V66_15970 [Ignavibacteria bacterium RBG_13_36_8]